MIFIEKLNYLIKERGLNNNQLLTELKMNRNAIQNWQSRGSQPRYTTVKKIADYFSVDVESLIDDDLEIEYKSEFYEEKNSFYSKLTLLMERDGITKKKLIDDLELNSSAIQNWRRQGSKPRAETMAKIADYFSVDVKSLENDNKELEYIPSKKNCKASNLISFYQRTVTLLGGYEITDEKLERISNCVNASIIFLTNHSALKYNPNTDCVSKRAEIKLNDIFEIIELSDRCADNEFIRVLMIQISKVILYRVAAKKDECDAGEDSRFDLYCCDDLIPEKLDYLYTNQPCKNNALNFGFNISEIITISKYTGLSCEYLITGKT